MQTDDNNDNNTNHDDDDDDNADNERQFMIHEFKMSQKGSNTLNSSHLSRHF